MPRLVPPISSGQPEPIRFPELPALAQLTRLIEARWRLNQSEPLTVPGDLFDAAYTELSQVLSERGFQLTSLPRPYPFENFTFKGVTILAAE